MLGLTSRRINAGLAASQLYDQDSFYRQFKKDVYVARSEVVIEFPFMTTKRATTLLPVLQKALSRGARVIVNTKPPDEQDEYLRAEAERAIPMLQEQGVEILLTGGHHRKLAMIDRNVLWEGSLNILSQADSCEVMRRISSEELAQQMINFIRVGHYVG